MSTHLSGAAQEIDRILRLRRATLEGLVREGHDVPALLTASKTSGAPYADAAKEVREAFERTSERMSRALVFSPAFKVWGLVESDFTPAPPIDPDYVCKLIMTYEEATIPLLLRGVFDANAWSLKAGETFESRALQNVTRFPTSEAFYRDVLERHLSGSSNRGVVTGPCVWSKRMWSRVKPRASQSSKPGLVPKDAVLDKLTSRTHPSYDPRLASALMRAAQIVKSEAGSSSAPYLALDELPAAMQALVGFDLSTVPAWMPLELRQEQSLVFAELGARKGLVEPISYIALAASELTDGASSGDWAALTPDERAIILGNAVVILAVQNALTPSVFGAAFGELSAIANREGVPGYALSPLGITQPSDGVRRARDVREATARLSIAPLASETLYRSSTAKLPYAPQRMSIAPAPAPIAPAPAPLAPAPKRLKIAPAPITGSAPTSTPDDAVSAAATVSLRDLGAPIVEGEVEAVTFTSGPGRDHRSGFALPSVDLKSWGQRFAAPVFVASLALLTAAAFLTKRKPARGRARKKR